MKLRIRLLILLSVLVAIMSLAIFTGVTTSYFLDDEQSTDDALGIQWGLFVLNDGFEDTQDWDQYWDENGVTTWAQSTTKVRTGTYSARSDNGANGYLTTDEMDSSTTANFTVSFWYYPKSLEAGDCLIQTYNGTAYNTLYDLTTHTNYANNTWCQFNELITDPQYLIAGFRLRFDSTGLTGGGEYIHIDDVYITTDTTPPVAPTNLSATAGDLQVDLDWDDNSENDIDHYNVYRSLTSGSGYVNTANSTSSDYIDTSISANTTYYYVVTAVDLATQESGYSNEDNATPYDNPPTAPASLSATAGDWQVDLDWDDNSESDFDYYNIYRSLTSGSGYVNTSNTTSSNYTDTSISAGTTYYYVVRAVDLASQESANSNEDNATPYDAAPANPTGLTAAGIHQQVDLDWDDNSESDFDHYHIYRSLTSGSGYVNTANVTSSNYTDTGLTNDTAYYYVITAVDDGSNESGYSNEANATPNAPPAAPANLAATVGDRQVNLNWDDNSEGDIAGYNVYRSTTAGPPYTQINVGLAPTSDYTDTNVFNNTTYYYVVTAVDQSDQESTYSNEVSATPEGTPITLLNDGFEGTPWDQYWNDNGTTSWTQDTDSYGGTYSAVTDKKTNGYLTSDNLTTTDAYQVSVSFWFKGKNLDAGDILVQIYNGTDYNTWYDITAYPAYVDNTWIQFSENITDNQYFDLLDFRLRFDSTGLTGGGETANVDDVLITRREP